MQNKHSEKQCYKNIALGKGHSDSNAMFFFPFEKKFAITFYTEHKCNKTKTSRWE